MHSGDDEFEAMRAREVSRAFQFYAGSFSKNLALLIADYEVLPIEIDNQIRNAFTHIVRTTVLSDFSDIRTEVDKAISHIDRANRDIFKTIIIKSREELRDLVADVVFHRGFLTPAIKTKMDFIESLRKEAYHEETMGHNGAAKALESIAVETLSLISEIKEQYHEAGSHKTRFLRNLKRWNRPFSYAICTLVGTAIGVAARPYLGIFFEMVGAWLKSG